MAKKILFSLFLIILVSHAFAQDYSLYKERLLISRGDTMPYRLLLPEDFNFKKIYPLILFMHGSGERGTDNKAQLIHGGSLFLRDSIRKGYPAIVVFPQCSPNGTWANAIGERDTSGKPKRTFFIGGKPTRDMVLVQKLVRKIIHEYPINKKQVYVGGLSLGGMGTFEIVRRNPKLFAAAFPICGGANVGIAPKLKHASWWVFHGADDNVVYPAYSKNMVSAMQALQIPVKFTLYPNTGHNCWDKTFDEPGLLEWLFSVKK
ncbi:alpha/beta hydrolase-fold protein [Parasediminibacterium sp. JCM 36343]|uniref:carboxylesterase family protein n=1 Tax=Parasediminibacterium sp. JCM 36343 TaxID=3374279 RepID=UPI003979449D